MTTISQHARTRSCLVPFRLSLAMRSMVTAISLAVWFTSSAMAEQQLTGIERELPQFNLESMNSGEWNVESLKGKPWIINFWATWCPPCIEEIPSMNKAWATLESQGVGMLAINAGEGKEAVLGFLAEFPIDFPTLLGDANTLSDWAVKALPTTVVINAEGTVVFEALGPREWDDEKLLARVLELL